MNVSHSAGNDRSSCEAHGRSAVAQALKVASELGVKITKLGLLLVQKIASYGPECFVVDRKLAEQIVQNNEHHPHPGSVARVRRMLARSEILLCKRIYPAQTISSVAKRHSTHGCVRSRLNRKLGFRPVPLRPPKPEPELATAGARHAATNSIVARGPALRTSDVEMFERMAAPAVAAASARELILEQQHDAAMYESVKRVRGPP